VKEFLSHAGHAFELRLVDEDDLAYDELLKLGFRTVPVTVVGQRAIAGFDAEALATALGVVG
jgi:hypothetical protein